MIDSSAFYAIVNRREVHHAEATEIFERLSRDEWRLFTSNFIIAEAHALILTRQGWDMGRRFLNQFESSKIGVIRVTEEDEQRAKEIIYRYSDKTFSYTDATSFAVMERLGIAFAFTFDSDFVQYGFPALGPGRG